MPGFRSLVIVALVASVVLGLHYRYQIMGLLHSQAAAQSQEKPDVLYSWVDKKGVTHFEQDSSKGVRIEYDGNRITPLVPVDPGQLAALDAATEADKAAQAQAAAAPEEQGQAAEHGSALIHQASRELHRNVQKMRAAKAAREGI